VLKYGLKVLVLDGYAHDDPMPGVPLMEQLLRQLRTAWTAREASCHLNILNRFLVKRVQIEPLFVIEVLPQKLLDGRMKSLGSSPGLGVIDVAHMEVLHHVDNFLAVGRGEDTFSLLLQDALESSKDTTGGRVVIEDNRLDKYLAHEAFHLLVYHLTQKPGLARSRLSNESYIALLEQETLQEETDACRLLRLDEVREEVGLLLGPPASVCGR
jgi:hypothetical protein